MYCAMIEWQYCLVIATWSARLLIWKKLRLRVQKNYCRLGVTTVKYRITAQFFTSIKFFKSNSSQSFSTDKKRDFVYEQGIKFRPSRGLNTGRKYTCCLFT